jgi:hypothetical protein
LGSSTRRACSVTGYLRNDTSPFFLCDAWEVDGTNGRVARSHETRDTNLDRESSISDCALVRNLSNKRAISISSSMNRQAKKSSSQE